MRRGILNSYRIGIFVIVALLMSVPASAQFAEDALRFSQSGLGVGVRSLGLGNAAIGLADDYSALYWNPAGLALIRDYEFSTGLSYRSYNNSAKFFGTTSTSSQNFINLNNLGLAYPIPTTRGSLTFAAGYGKSSSFGTIAQFSGFNPSSSLILSRTPSVNLYSLSQNERKDLLDNNIPYQLFLADTVNGKLVSVVSGNVLQNVTVREGGGINFYSFGGAIDIAKDLSFGVALNIASGSYTYDREYIESDSKNNYTRGPGQSLGQFDRFSLISTIEGNINGVNALFGVMYRKKGTLRIGATVRTPTSLTISESFLDEATSRFDPNANGTVDKYNISFDGKTEYRVVTPLVFGAGVSARLLDWLLLAGDIEYTDWTQIRFDSNNPDLLSENRLIKKIFQPTTNLRGGAEFSLWDLGLHLRGGFNWKPSPFKNDGPDFDQMYLTGGIGIDIDDRVTVNAGYARGKWKTFRDNYVMSTLPSASKTDETILTENILVGLTYRF